MNHTQQQKQTYLTNKETIKQILNWQKSIAYETLQYEMGMAYLLEILNGNAHDIACYEVEQAFWNWFKNTWNIIDDELLLSHLLVSPKPELIYREAHKPKYIFTSPMAVMFEYSYAQMIGTIHDNKLQKA